MDSNDLSIDDFFSNLVCSIKFFLILDNSGNRIYCSYYLNTSDENKELNSIENQRSFEKNLCEKISKSNIDRIDLDIINFENYNILCKVNSEVNIFIGTKEDDNEILLEKIYDAFESQLFDIVQDNLSREKIFSCYDKLVILIDKIIYGGLALNINKDSLNERVFENKIKYENRNENGMNSKDKEKKGNFFSSLFGF